MSVKLTDAQLVMMSAAAQREDRCLAAPERLKGAAVSKVSAKLVKLGLAREIRAKAGTPIWSRGEEGQAYALKLTATGLKAIAVDEGPEEALEPSETAQAQPVSEAKTSGSPDDVGRRTHAVAPREGSKLALVINLLRGEARPYVRKRLDLAPYDVAAHRDLLATLAACGRFAEGEAHLVAATHLFTSQGLSCAPLDKAWREHRQLAARGTRPESPPLSVPPPAAAETESGHLKESAFHAERVKAGPPHLSIVAPPPLARLSTQTSRRAPAHRPDRGGGPVADRHRQRGSIHCRRPKIGRDRRAAERSLADFSLTGQAAAASLDRRAAVRKSLRRCELGLFRRRHHGKSYRRAFAPARLLRDRTQHRLHFQGQKC